MPNIKLRVPQPVYEALSAIIEQIKQPRQTGQQVELVRTYPTVEDYVAALIRDAAANELRARPSARAKQLMEEIAAKQRDLEVELAPAVEPDRT